MQRFPAKVLPLFPKSRSARRGRVRLSVGRGEDDDARSPVGLGFSVYEDCFPGVDGFQRFGKGLQQRVFRVLYSAFGFFRFLPCFAEPDDGRAAQELAELGDPYVRHPEEHLHPPEFGEAVEGKFLLQFALDIVERHAFHLGVVPEPLPRHPAPAEADDALLFQIAEEAQVFVVDGAAPSCADGVVEPGGGNAFPFPVVPGKRLAHLLRMQNALFFYSIYIFSELILISYNNRCDILYYQKTPPHCLHDIK